jgi:hypothetical protein
LLFPVYKVIVPLKLEASSEAEVPKAKRAPINIMPIPNTSSLSVMGRVCWIESDESETIMLSISCEMHIEFICTNGAGSKDEFGVSTPRQSDMLSNVSRGCRPAQDKPWEATIVLAVPVARTLWLPLKCAKCAKLKRFSRAVIQGEPTVSKLKPPRSAQSWHFRGPTAGNTLAKLANV